MARHTKQTGTKNARLARAEALRARAIREYEAAKWVVSDSRVRQAVRRLNRSAGLAKDAVVEAQRWFMDRIGLRPQQQLAWEDIDDVLAVVAWDDPEHTPLHRALARLCEAASDVLRHDSWKPMVRIPPRYAGRIVAGDTRAAIDGFKRFARLDPDSTELRTLVRAIRMFASEARAECESCGGKDAGA